MDEQYPDRMLLAEANHWPEDAIAYFGRTATNATWRFTFRSCRGCSWPLRLEDRFPIIEILRRTPPIPENCQWALFLRNHDELTLEMVTDEERDYMYRVYAADSRRASTSASAAASRRCSATTAARIELMNALLFSLPGTPVIYYGDEIGMGDNIYLGDRNGVRTPMQWSPDRNAGFSAAIRNSFICRSSSTRNTTTKPSMSSRSRTIRIRCCGWMKRLIVLRKQYRRSGAERSNSCNRPTRVSWRSSAASRMNLSWSWQISPQIRSACGPEPG